MRVGSKKRVVPHGSQPGGSLRIQKESVPPYSGSAGGVAVGAEAPWVGVGVGSEEQAMTPRTKMLTKTARTRYLSDRHPDMWALPDAQESTREVASRFIE
jgi:hypothetical protein